MNAGEILQDPSWHMYDFRVRRREFWFARMRESDYNESVFLDARIQTERAERLTMSFREVLSLFEGQPWGGRAPRFIFHTGHCGSTLMSRAFQDGERILPLREPMTLNTLSDLRREVGHPICLLNQALYDKVSAVIVAAMSRTFRVDQQVVVKPTSTCTNLVGDLMRASPDSRALLMFQSLQNHVAGRIDSGGGIHDLYMQARERMQDWISIPGHFPLFNSKMNPAQMAVLSWITSMYFLLSAEQQFPDRVRPVEFDEFLQAPHDRLLELSDFLGLPLNQDQLQRQWEDVSGQYSKMPGRGYSTEVRRKKLSGAMQRHRKTVERALGFARQLIERVPALEPVAPHLC